MRSLFPRITCGVLAVFLALTPLLRATETENQLLHFLPAPPTLKIDGSTDAWDLSAGIFACGDVERLRDQYALWLNGMYDDRNVYFLARWIDPTPLNNDQSSKGGHGFAGDCLQIRFITNYGTDSEVITWLTCWRDRDGISVVDRAQPKPGKDSHRKGVILPQLPDALAHGASQAFKVNADGKGYVQEVAIPWSMLTADGKAPAAGSQVRVAVEPNFTAGPDGRVSIKDLFREGVVPDRVFTFRGYDQWGTGVLETSPKVKSAAVRLADGREFPVRVDNGIPVVDWTGLIKLRELPGFKTIAIDMPFDGYASLNIRDKTGAVVRQLLGAEPLNKGRHDLKWDGLATPVFRAPAQPLPAGEYTWEAIAHPGLKVTLRGWAASSGQFPWSSGPTSGWGGDHGLPDACATDGKQMYLGWNGAEAGKSVVACDLDGQVRWRIGTGLGESSEHLAVDRGIVFSLGWWDGLHGRQLIRMRSSDGVFDNWQGRASAAIEIPELWEGRPDAALMPSHADSMAVRDGTLYLSFSDPSLSAADVTNWKALATKLTEPGPLGERVLAELPEFKRKRLADLIAGKLKIEQVFQSTNRDDHFERDIIRSLNGLLDSCDFVPGSSTISHGKRARANRLFLLAHFGAALRPARTDFIAVCDARSAKVQSLIDVPAPEAMCVASDSLIYIISDGTTIVELNPKLATHKTLIYGLKGAVSLAVDPGGKIYVGVRGFDQQVKVFTPDGKPAGEIGSKGGREAIGPWDWHRGGMLNVGAIVVDARKRLWVTEMNFTPKRVSVWNLADGKFIAEYFGATHYGASGAAISPLDPNMMVSEGCEWRLDPATGQARCMGVVSGFIDNYAVFCTPSNGHLYLALVKQTESETSLGKYTRINSLEIYERIAEGNWKLRSIITPDRDGTSVSFWSDANSDGVAQASEIVTVPEKLEFVGSNAWSLSMNPNDFTLYAANPLKQQVVQIRPAGFTASGAPKWDTANIKILPVPWGRTITDMLPDAENHKLVVCEGEVAFRCHDLADGRLLWSYPNPFYQVHGSHKAPPPEPGLIRGAYGLIGTARLPELGTVWCINTNVGEWHLLSEQGFYLSRLFQGDVMQQRFPASAAPGADLTGAPSGSGGEDFGGSMVQTRDGRIYVQTGKTAAWNTEVTGFDKIQKIGSGTVELTSADLPLARAQYDQQMQTAAGTKLAEIHALSPTMTGNPAKDFAGVQPLSYKKQDDAAVKTWAAWDDSNLYLAWEVADPTPWVNGASEPAQMYLSGDTVDFQFGGDPKANPKRGQAVAGDLRISIGNFRGEPTAVLYRKISEVKKPRAFTSGVVPHYEMDFVDVLAAARLHAAPRKDGKSYVVEAVIPWESLGFHPTPDTKYRGDFGVTHGDAAGARTRLRTHWNNQETGLVDDAVFELQMVPRNWGEIVFRN